MATYVLTAADEGTHDPGGEPLFNESVYVNAFSHAERLGGWLRLGNRANEGYAELAVCLFLPDGRIACQFTRPPITHNETFDAGGMCYRVHEPFERVSMRYEGEVMLVSDRSLFRDPKRLFGEAPREHCLLDWQVSGCSPVHGGLPAEPGGQTMFGRDFSLGHFNQHTAVSGTLKIGSLGGAFEGFGWRDHSWGPRLWQNILFDRGFYVSFGEDRGLTLLKIANRDGEVRRSGVLFRDGRYETITDLDVLTDWDDDRDPRAVTLSARTASSAAVITGQVLNVAPLRNRRTIDGEVMSSRIAEAFTEFEWDGRRGYGMTEYVEQLVDGQPAGWPL